MSGFPLGRCKGFPDCAPAKIRRLFSRMEAQQTSQTERTALLAITAEIARVFLDARDIEGIGAALDAVIDKLAYSEMVGFYLVEPESGRLRLVYARGFRDEEETRMAEASAWERHPGDVIRSGLVLDEPDCSEENGARTTSSPRSFVVRSRLYVPVLGLSGTIGALGLGASVVHAFSPVHLAVLTFLANAIGLAYERVVSEGLVRRRESVLRAVSRSAEILLGAQGGRTEVGTALRELGEAADVSRVYVFENFRDDEGVVYARQTHEWTAGDASAELENPELQAIPYVDAGFARWAESLPRNEVIAGAVAGFPASERTLLVAQDILSILLVPIFVEGEWWGLLGFDDCRRVREWSEPEVDAIRTAARLIGATAQRDRAERALRERAEDQALLLDNIETRVWYLRDEQTYGAINQAHAAFLGRSPGEVEGLALQDLLSSDEAEVCAAWNREVFLRRERVHSEEWVRDASGDLRLLSVVKTPKLAPDGRVEYVVASAEDITERWRIGQELEQARAQLEERVEQRTGELRLANEQLRSEVDERRRMEEQVREHGSRLRELALALVRAEERERRRIAVGLHDQIGQSLALCRMQVGAAVEGQDGGAGSGPLREVAEILDDVMRSTRSLTFELSLPILYELGLWPALEWLVERTEGRGLRCVGSCLTPLPDLSVDARVCVFQVARELLGNVVRHAQASTAWLSIGVRADRLALRVRDDGRGMEWPPRDPRGASGFGLFGIKERVHALGGVFTVHAEPGEGAVVDVEIPTGAIAASLGSEEGR